MAFRAALRRPGALALARPVWRRGVSSLAAGIVGLPNVGKSTLFNALTNSSVAAENYPFCTIDPSTGIAILPDERLSRLSAFSSSLKTVPTSFQIVDIAGLIEGASKGLGLGNRFLSKIREVDAILHVVRCFDGDGIAHVKGEVDPIKDVMTIEAELLLADLQTLEKSLEKTKKARGDMLRDFKVSLLESMEEHLMEGNSVRTLEITEAEAKKFVNSLHLLSSKDVLFVANVGEKDLPMKENDHYKSLQSFLLARDPSAALLPLCVRVEGEIAVLEGMDAAEKEEFARELGLETSDLPPLLRKIFSLLKMRTYFTTGEKETRAWSIRDGDCAATAAGRIHSDFERGFIKASVIHSSTLLEVGSFTKAREIGLLRLEGRDYIVEDGDVMEFFFNV